MPAGRPSKLTPQLQQQIVNLIRIGNYIETACMAAGIDKSTWHDWMRRGARERERIARNARARLRKSEAPFVEFSHAVIKAQNEAETISLARITKAGETQWQANAWRLERMHPERWGRRDRMQHEHTGNLALATAVRFELPANGRDADKDEPVTIDAKPVAALPAAGTNGGNGDGGEP